ncbi:unnamed protein product [Polarella glacialis]|uniref:Uncharacterized protein n=1 Tax=Polarella glacialis TaxID=89957 RepID=A0A813FHT6_POLGL|nr:unnamed protein product [Polarella glacialis]
MIWCSHVRQMVFGFFPRVASLIFHVSWYMWKTQFNAFNLMLARDMCSWLAQEQTCWILFSTVLLLFADLSNYAFSQGLFSVFVVVVELCSVVIVCNFQIRFRYHI